MFYAANRVIGDGRFQFVRSACIFILFIILDNGFYTTMTRWCAVPECKTNSRAETIKRSVFLVPKDTAQLKKWINAIPGITELKTTSVICEKHFKNSDIIKEWVHYGQDGRIITQVSFYLYKVYVKLYLS